MLKGLTRGTHTIQEKSVPDGYTKNPGVLKFSVDENNKITLLENTATDKTGTMKFTVREDGTAQLSVEDVLAPYELIVHKVNDHAKVLEGAEFTLYKDEECKQELQKATSGKDGILRFQDLEVETKYYLKETKAPEGYRIPVNSDGTDIVYEIYTKSDPQKDLFEYYVNGKKYTDTTGDFDALPERCYRTGSASKSSKFCGMQMPETKTGHWESFWWGIGCPDSGRILYEEKGNRKMKRNKVWMFITLLALGGISKYCRGSAVDEYRLQKKQTVEAKEYNVPGRNCQHGKAWHGKHYHQGI